MEELHRLLKRWRRTSALVPLPRSEFSYRRFARLCFRGHFTPLLPGFFTFRLPPHYTHVAAPGYYRVRAGLLQPSSAAHSRRGPRFAAGMAGGFHLIYSTHTRTRFHTARRGETAPWLFGQRGLRYGDDGRVVIPRLATHAAACLLNLPTPPLTPAYHAAAPTRGKPATALRENIHSCLAFIWLAARRCCRRIRRCVYIAVIGDLLFHALPHRCHLRFPAAAPRASRRHLILDSVLTTSRPPYPPPLSSCSMPTPCMVPVLSGTHCGFCYYFAFIGCRAISWFGSFTTSLPFAHAPPFIALFIFSLFLISCRIPPTTFLHLPLLPSILSTCILPVETLPALLRLPTVAFNTGTYAAFRALRVHYTHVRTLHAFRAAAAPPHAA